jgi:hypothetical protein
MRRHLNSGSRFGSLLDIIVIFVFLFSAALSAQITTADIVGTVTDASGALVPGARVTVRNLGTQAVSTAQTGSSGEYVFIRMPVGHYNIRVEASGFKSWTAPEVTLAIGDRLRQDVHLELGRKVETVEVQGQSPALQSQSATVGTLVTEQSVQELPLNGRNFISLAVLPAGASEGAPNFIASGTRADDRRRSSSLSVNAQSPSLNNFLIDGMDDNERFVGVIAVRPSLDSLEEFRVETNLYSAEIGRTSGAVVNMVTKSGTNVIHGSAFEYLRNEKVDAKNFFAGPGPTPPYKQNSFGGSIGGPIQKDKTFIFGDYEGLRLRQGITYTSTVPTMPERQGIFTGVNRIFDPATTTQSSPGVYTRQEFQNDIIPRDLLNPQSLKLMSFYPVPTTSSLVNNYSWSPVKSQRDDLFDIRLDRRFSERDNLFGRYTFDDIYTLVPDEMLAGGVYSSDGGVTAGPSSQRDQGVQINYVHTFSPSLLLNVVAGYTRFVTFTVGQNYGKNIMTQIGVPNVNIDPTSSGLSTVTVSGYRGLGGEDFLPNININNVFQGAASIAYTRRNHSIKVGSTVIRRRLVPSQSRSPMGDFGFNGNFTNDPTGATPNSGNGMASLLLGYVASESRQTYLVYPEWHFIEPSAYVQDDWRVKPWLTLTLGLRYDYFSPGTEKYNRIANVVVGPQSAQILVAGQNGTPPDAGITKDFRNFGPRFGFAATVAKGTVIRGGFGITYNPPQMGSNLAMRNAPFVSLYNYTASPLILGPSISDGLPYPYPTTVANLQGSVVEEDPNLRTPYVQQYNLTVQREMPLGFVASIGYVGDLSRRGMIGWDANQAPPGPGAVLPRRPYNGLWPNVSGITVWSSWGNGEYQALQANLERRSRNGLGLNANYTWAHSLDNYNPSGSGLTNGYTLPEYIGNFNLYDRGSSDLDIRQRFTIMLNYQLPFAKAATGWHGALVKGWETNLIGILSGGYPFTVTDSGSRANTGDGDRPNQIADPNLPKSQRSVTRWFNTQAFAAQPLNTIGNAGRNTVRAPGLKNLDFSIVREFKLTERMNLQFRMEAFNITNTPNFDAPASSFGTGAFGVISGTANFLPRNIQFALKLRF